MGGIQAKIQTVEDVYRLVRRAVVSKRPMRAIYHGQQRWLCPHQLGRNHAGQSRVLCYQYAGESSSRLEAPGSPANWRCIALEKLSRVELLEEAWRTAPNMPPTASAVGLAKRGVIPRKQFYIKMFVFNTVVQVD